MIIHYAKMCVVVIFTLCINNNAKRGALCYASMPSMYAEVKRSHEYQAFKKICM